jgi:IS30 family transposase
MTIDGGIALVIIWDRGMKLAQHKGLTVDTTVGVFFMAHKASGSWARMNIRTLAV